MLAGHNASSPESISYNLATNGRMAEQPKRSVKQEVGRGPDMPQFSGVRSTRDAHASFTFQHQGPPCFSVAAGANPAITGSTREPTPPGETAPSHPSQHAQQVSAEIQQAIHSAITGVQRQIEQALPVALSKCQNEPEWYAVRKIAADWDVLMEQMKAMRLQRG